MATRERLLGPYPHGRVFRLIYVAPDGERRPIPFPTAERAEEYKRAFEAEIVRCATSVDEAIDAYERHLKTKGNKPGSIKETVRRLRRFFAGELATPLDVLTPPACKRIYKTLAESGLAADSHRNMLLEARSFLRWCVGQRWLLRNPLDGVEGIGRRKHGKLQPRLDEARRWQARALEMAGAGDDGALAALMTMMMGLSASEITKRRVRDLDDGGQLLWIEEAKTEARNAPVEVPELLQPLLVAHAKDRAGEEPLFVSTRGKARAHWRDWPRENVQRICAELGLPSITAQGMRGFAATLVGIARRGSLDEAARVLRHESPSTTATSYADRKIMEREQRRAALKVLAGGRDE